MIQTDHTEFVINKGSASPQGSTLMKDGVNFSLYSKNATAVTLLLFKGIEDVTPFREIKLDRQLNKTYHYWHIHIEGLKAGQLYGYRVHGPHDPMAGHRFDSAKILIDPYSKAITVPKGFDRKSAGTNGNSQTPCMKSVVADLSVYDWEGDERLNRPFAQTVIYEMHVAGFTKHPNSGVSAEKRGTYAGIIEKLPYLADLGITAIELLPVFQFDAQDSPAGKVNYWGYSPVSFFAPHAAYSSSSDPLAVLDEFRDMVKACHRAGIEVILDVVFNHTSEGDENGPTYSFRGIDNSIYYITETDKSRYANFSGTGNTLNANQPIVRRMIMDSLHFWVKKMHVDGFRFDLASILSRDEKGNTLENPPVLWDIESDPCFAGIKLIAEAWDAGGLYQVGSFIGDSWKEWNGQFRDDVRSFLKGDQGKLAALAARLLGSPDIYAHENREPEQSINFVTCHDGFTLNDLVSYNQKHNEANGENNHDGNNDNLSWNCGVEGETTDPEIEALRKRQIKNFLTTTLISIGTPMLLMGDEVRRTQKGNNNAYCQDNEISWFDWSLVEKNQEIFRFTKLLIQTRLNRDSSRPELYKTLNEMIAEADLTWHGIKILEPDWSHHSSSIAVTIRSMTGSVLMHYMLNAYYQPLVFTIPTDDKNANVNWKRWLDTSLSSPQDILPWEESPTLSAQTYTLPGRSLAILAKN